ncbi:kinase-like domain-containing protein [Dichomitus squalens]|uniref:Kinase-like domain-containing protein n=1 Tax=Dichomitus squalens TaxID=114155 RepID=A0A4Q9P796_9APHY|nr:kinase-like domain-containing protein [Dichomitus squalens]TBU59668.1 kinase-like domain-containing protein [Dichomitus squalens]
MSDTMSVDSDKACPQPTDGLHNYVLQAQLASGSISQVFRAVCKRGRMRNRFVAVKKISYETHRDTSRSAKDLVSAASIHSALCHPTIVTLISSFVAPSGYYHVLELCENGNLADFLHARDPQALTEEELRGVARTLVDALLYLKKERVVHRDIKPSNVLITGNYRLKLSGLNSAIRLPRPDATETAFCGSPNYVSPEILSGLPYRFTTDLWSVGAVLVTCLTGQPAFHAPTPAEVFDNICCARYMLPDGASYEVVDLIAGLLQKVPEDRMPLHRIFTHPFFKPSLITHPLTTERVRHGCDDNSGKDVLKPYEPSHLSSQRYPALLSTDPARLRPMTDNKRQLAFKFKRAPLEDITNFFQDDPQDDTSLVPPPRRTASAPANSPLAHLYNEDSRPPTPALTTDSGTPSVSSIASLAENQARGLGASGVPASPRTELKRVLSDPCGSTKLHLATGAPLSNQLVPSSHHTKLPMHRIVSQATSSTAVSHRGNGSVNIARFSTRRLKSQTHKVSRGQLVVLPSKALLVDFREGERRKGYDGKQVLMISSDGDMVEVYDAPHLSTPCCLAEPVAIYTSKQLPPEYAKQYEDAMKIVNQLNARIPKLVHFAEDAKCTLMANGPPGDVEIHMPSEEAEGGDDREAIRLRLQRSKHILEISRHVNKASGTRRDIGEWTKKVIPLSHMLELPEDDWRSFDGLERVAMARLEDFLRICDAAEMVEAGGGTTAIATDQSKYGGDGRERLERVLRHMEIKATDKTPEDGGRPPSRSGSCASVVASVVVRPRPRKFSSTAMLR